MGYKSSQWAGKGQIREKGGKIKEGEEGHPVFVPQMKTIEEINEKTGKTEERKIFLGWSIYEVFNADQQEGAEYDASKPQQVWSESADAEEILQVAKDYIRYKEQEGAYYSPREDLIVLPIREQFKSTEAFYGTSFHEVVHWTGASTRLNRFGSSAVASFGSKNYSFEELVAEFGASMLKSRACIDDGVPNAAAYIKSWWSRLESDMDELMKAYSIALKAVDYILAKPFGEN
jgi:antirestriction protein ArdC